MEAVKISGETTCILEIKHLLGVLRTLLTTRTQNLENKLGDGVLEAPTYLPLSQCGDSTI